MIANRRRPGTTSRKSSSRLPASSFASVARPVTLPPGRARLATRPLPTGSPAVANTIGMTDVAFFDAIARAIEHVAAALAEPETPEENGAGIARAYTLLRP
jgi:hypothetical protein